MKIMITTLMESLIRRASQFISKSEKRRFTIGFSLSIASVLYTFFIVDVDGAIEVGTLMLNSFNAFLFILGLVIVTKSMDTITRIFTRIVLELLYIIITVFSLNMIAECMAVPLNSLKGFRPLLLLASLFAATAYIMRVSFFIYILLKKLSAKVMERIKKVNIKTKTEFLDAVLKNTVSIAGTIAVIYKFLEPLINKIL